MCVCGLAFFWMYFYTLKMARYNKIFVSAITLKYFNLDNKAISKPIFKCWWLFLLRLIFISYQRR